MRSQIGLVLPFIFIAPLLAILNPQVENENGNLVFTAADSRNISFLTSQGLILFNGINLSELNRTNRMTRLTSWINRALSRKINETITPNVDVFKQEIARLNRTIQQLQEDLIKDECDTRPCRHNAVCIDGYKKYTCKCSDSWMGERCEEDVNECNSLAGTDKGCQNGAVCINTEGSFRCQCAIHWFGALCDTRGDSCKNASNIALCAHGTCLDQNIAHEGVHYKCLCDPGWKTDGHNQACNVDIDECQLSAKCHEKVQCVNTPGSFACGDCPLGFVGNGFQCTDIDECLLNNGGCSRNPYVQCTNLPGSFVCDRCPQGFSGNGRFCLRASACTNHNCNSMARCQELSGVSGGTICQCPPGYYGDGIGPNGCQVSSTNGFYYNPCSSNPCNTGSCIQNGRNYMCQCPTDRTGINCEIPSDACNSFPCQNNGVCTNAGVGQYTCSCKEGFTGESCENDQPPCGAVLTSSSGVVKYPLADTSYTANLMCVWTFRSSNIGKVISLKFTEFDLEEDATCSYDYVEIFDGESRNHSLTGKKCGSQLRDTTINGTGHVVSLVLITDDTEHSDGFTLHWFSLTQACGYTKFNATSGIVQSPNYPNPYPHNSRCRWSIEGLLGHVFNLQFDDVRIEHHPSCEYDYLEIRDGLMEDSPLIERICYSRTPIKTNGPAFHLYFHTDSTDTDSGFQLSYSSERTCGGMYTQESGNITSPGFPYSYAENLRCSWLIAPGTHKFTVSFPTFSLEQDHSCDYDYIEVRKGRGAESPLVGKYCNEVPDPIEVYDSSLYIHMKTDESVPETGFRIEWKTECVETFGNVSGIIKSPSFPENYSPNLNCSYSIKATYNTLVMLNFLSFDLEEKVNGVCSDYLLIQARGKNERLCGSLLTTQKEYAGPVDMKFVSNDQGMNSGFLIDYVTRPSQASDLPIDDESESSGDVCECNCFLKKEIGFIVPPSHFETNPHEINCTWTIEVNPSHVINLKFTTMNLEYSSECEYDFIEVFDDLRETKKIGKYCGSSYQEPILSSSHVLVIRFQTDYSDISEGFHLDYNSVDMSRICGRTLIMNEGDITSPGFPGKYQQKTCEWIIKAQPNHKINLRVLKFVLEDSSNCIHDSLEIRNGGSTSSPLIGKYCGNSIPENFTSFDSRMYLKFRTDDSVEEEGFHIHFESTTAGCGGTLSSSSGTIHSPNYPSSPSQLSECFYKIKTSEGSRVKLHFTDFNLPTDYNCQRSFVKIKASEQDSIGKSLCGANIQPVYLSDKNVMLIDYRFNSREINGRFAASFHTECNVDLSGVRGSIESPNYPKTYTSGMNCKWKVKGSQGNKLVFDLIKFKLNTRSSSCSDYLQILDANDQLKIKMCNDTGSTHFEYESENITVEFVSSESYLERDFGEGFKLDYRVEGCGEDFLEEAGSFTSPNYPQPYKLDHECQWSITVASQNKIQLTIEDIDIEKSLSCTYDYLKIFNVANGERKILMTACHKDEQKKTMTSITNQLHIEFKSDSSQPGKGFNITWQAINNDCTHRFTIPSAQISSPNYPNLYPMNVDCIWKIEIQKGHRIKLEIQEFDFEQSDDCDWDYIVIYNDLDRENLISKICENAKGMEFYSNGSIMLINMITDDSQAHTGFKALYTTECGAVIEVTNDEHGSLQSPFFPGEYPNNLNCTWIIKNQRLGDKLNLEFVVFQVEEAGRYMGNCTDALEIYNGEGTDAPLFGTYCGTQAPPPFTSAGSTVTLKFRSDGYEQKTGFDVIYTRSHSVCGLTYKNQEGTINSPRHPGMYPSNYICLWNITGTPGSHFEIKFLVFDIDDSPNCLIDRLNISYRNTTVSICSQEQADSQSRIHEASTIQFIFESGSRHSKNFGGFSIKYKIAYGGHLSNWGEGVIESPNYPLLYENSLDITWILTPPNGQTIRFIFEAIDLEKDEICYDFVQITEGMGSDNPQICGTELPYSIITEHSPVKIRFYTDSSVPHKGFRLTWKSDELLLETQINTLAPPRCGGDYVLGSNSNYTIVSPNYPSDYGPNKLCEWSLVSLSGFIVLSIVDMNIEEDYDCIYDFLKIVDDEGDTATIKLCGSRKGDYLVRSTKALLTFKSDPDTEHKGFKLYASTACDRTFHQNAGVITSPNYTGNYPVSMNCSSYVTVDQGQTIGLTFLDFDVYCLDSNRPKSGDYIEIFEGPEAVVSMKVLCGQSIPSYITSISNKIVIRFNSNSDSNVGRGFKIVFMAMSSGCSNNFELTDAIPTYVIQSPNYPQLYPSSSDCVWVVTTNDEKRLAATFNSRFVIHSQNNLTCERDKLIVRDGGSSDSSLIGTFCGDKNPETIRSSGAAIYFRFVSDLTNGGEGFKITVRKGVCGGTYYHSQGSISSPNYPNNYTPNQNCMWTISVPVHHFVTVSFEDLDINDCNDKLIFRDFNSTGPEITTVCSSIMHIESAGNILVIIFNTNSYTQSKGFKINYISSSEVCGGDLSLESGTIQSPNYPLSMSRRRYCEWTINAPQNKKVTVNITDFSIAEQDHRCEQGYLLILNGKYEDSPQLFNSCRIRTSTVFKSSYNVIKLTYFVTRQSHGKGFKLIYNTVEEDYCSSMHDKVNHVINMPANSAANSVECIFQIDFPSHSSSKTTSITFDSVPPLGKNCDFFWEFEEYPANRKLGRFCESNPPPTTGILSVSSVIKIRISYKNQISKNMTIRYKYNECGGKVNEETFIESSNFPLLLGSGTKCLWQIEAPSHYVIKITGYGSAVEIKNCDATFVEIKNGLHSNSPVIVKDCNLNSSTSYITQTNMARVGLFSDNSSTQAIDFRLKIEFVSKGCGGWYHGKEGVIHALSWPNQSVSVNTYCSWKIRVPIGYHIEASFADPFQLPPRIDGECREYIEVKSPFWNNERYCGSTNPGTLKVNTNEMDVNLLTRFTSHSNKISGFKLNYTSVCGANRTGFEGQISTPNYPSKYYGNSSCISYIYLPDNKNVSISIPEFYSPYSVSQNRVLNRHAFRNRHDYYYLNFYGNRHGFDDSYCPKDYIEIGTLNGTARPQKICNSWQATSFILKTPVYVKFFSSLNVTEHLPFSLNYKLVDCNLEFTDEFGIIRSPHQFNLNQAFSCKWLVHLNDTRMVIRFRFSEPPRLWNCRISSLVFTDVYPNNTERTLKQICGYGRFDRQFISKSNKVKIEFNRNTNRRRNEDVFQFAYQGVFKCGGYLRNENGSFEAFHHDPSPNSFYEPNLFCKWTIIVQNESSVHVTFKTISFPNNTQEYADYIQIFDNVYNLEPTLTIRDNKTNFEIISATNIIIINFVSNNKYESIAMKAEYKTVPRKCGGILDINDDETKTLSNPSDLTQNIDYILCHWNIKAGTGKHIQIDFSSFNLPLEQNCPNSYLKFSERVTEIRRSGRLCGNSLPHQVTSISNEIQLTYYVSQENRRDPNTFRFNYQIKTCNQVFHASSGSIESPAYPHYTPLPERCNYTIIASPGYEIVLISVDTNLYNNRGCRRYFEISTSEPGTFNTTKICNSEVNINIPTNQATISYVAERIIYGSFMMTYFTHPKEKKCGGSIDALEGVITSPKHPATPLEAYNCTWTISFRTPYHLNLRLGIKGISSTECLESKSFIKLGLSRNMTCLNLNRYHTFVRRRYETGSQDTYSINYWTLNNSTENLNFRLNFKLIDPHEVPRDRGDEVQHQDF